MGNRDKMNLSSLFSATLSGIPLSILTRSLTERFCRLFTKRSLLVTVTHKVTWEVTLQTCQTHIS